MFVASTFIQACRVASRWLWQMTLTILIVFDASGAMLVRTRRRSRHMRKLNHNGDERDCPESLHVLQ